MQSPPRAAATICQDGTHPVREHAEDACTRVLLSP